MDPKPTLLCRFLGLCAYQDLMGRPRTARARRVTRRRLELRLHGRRRPPRILWARGA